MISTTRAIERPVVPRSLGPRPGGLARCLPLVDWLIGAPSCLAPAGSRAPRPCQIASSWSWCETSGGPDAWRRLPSSASQCKTTSKVTVSGRRSGKKNKTHVRVVDYEGYAERRIAAPVRVGQSRLFGWRAEALAGKWRQTAADCVTLAV